MKKGTLLVEIMIASAIFSFVGIVALLVIKVADEAWTIDARYLGLQQQLRSSVGGMIREIRQAKKETGRDLTVAADFESIQFFIPGISTPVQYYVQGGKLVREHPTNSLTVLANDITQLGFCCVGGASCIDCAGASQVQIHIEGSKVLRGRAALYELDEKAVLRNE